MKSLFERIRYYIKGYIVIMSYFTIIFCFIFILINAFTNNLNKRKDFYDYLKDEYYYAEMFDVVKAKENNVNISGVLYNLEIENIGGTNVYVYHYNGDINLGISYSQTLIIDIKSTREISTGNVIVSSDAYEVVNGTYNVSKIIDVEFPYYPALYSTKKIKEEPLILIEEEESYFDTADYAIFKSDNIKNTSKYGDIVKGSSFKSDRLDDIKSIVLIFDIVLIIPIVISSLCLLPLVEFIFRDMEKEIYTRMNLGQRPLSLYMYLFLYILLAIIGGYVIGVVLGYLISAPFFELNVISIPYVFIFILLSTLLMTKLVLVKITRRRLRVHA